MQKEFIEKIQEYFKNCYLGGSVINSRLNKNKDLKNKCEQILSDHPEFLKISLLIRSICLNDYVFRKCEKCGKILNYYQNKRRSRFCNSCRPNSFILYADKIKQTNLKKYGSESPLSSKTIREKIKKTNLEKYRGNSPSSSVTIRNKIKNTCLEKYGAENPQQNKEIQNKTKQTNMKKYGVPSYVLTENFKDKEQEGSMKKYGTENPFNSPKFREELKRFNVKKYGVEYPVKTEIIKNKIVKTNNEQFGSDYIQQSQFSFNKTYDNFKRFESMVIPLFDKTEFHGYRNGQIYKWKCQKCGNEFFDSCMHSGFLPGYSNMPRCENCFPYNTMSGKSLEEKQLMDFCRSYFKNIKENADDIIAPYELDIYIPEIKTAIEFNGLYWHSSKYADKCYHLNKTILCESIGIKLIHIWEDEWINSNDKIKMKLIDLFSNKKISYSDEILKLDRCWNSFIEIPGYILKEITQPELILRGGKYHCWNCGYLIYEKQVNNIKNSQDLI